MPSGDVGRRAPVAGWTRAECSPQLRVPGHRRHDNSIVAVEQYKGAEMNAMVNPGAITSTSMVKGATAEEIWGSIIGTYGDFAGRPLSVNQEVYKSEAEKSLVMPVVERVAAELKAAGFRLKVDSREELTPGFKFNDWEMRGVPLRIEIGPKDVEKGSVMAARRDVPGRDGIVNHLAHDQRV